jgi:peroxiredoxin
VLRRTKQSLRLSICANRCGARQPAESRADLHRTQQAVARGRWIRSTGAGRARASRWRGSCVGGRMNTKLIPLLALAFATSATHAALAVGDNAPGFEAPASLAGKTFTYSLGDALKRGPVVVYFYPSAYTGGCNLEAHTFAVQQEKFLAAGASIVGVSLDDIGRLNTFSADPDYCGGRIAVASDPDGRIAHAYALRVRDAAPGRKDTRGVAIEHGFAERSTFVVTPDGRVAAAFDGLSPVENVEHALAAVQQLAQPR